MDCIAKDWLSNVMCLITSARNNGHVRVNCGVKATGRQAGKLTDIEAEINQRDGSIPADIVASSCRQLFFHMVRLVTPFNRRAGGRLSVAAVILDRHCKHTGIHKETYRPVMGKSPIPSHIESSTLLNYLAIFQIPIVL